MKATQKQKTSQNSKISEDARFDKVYSDPRFIVAPNKMKKVEIDTRFKKMFSDKQFNVIAKVDKYGRKIDKKDTYALQNYYSKDQEKQQPSKLELVGKKFYDEDGNFAWSGKSESESSGHSSDSQIDENKSKSDEESMTYSDELSGVWSDISEPKEQAETTQQDQNVKFGKRIAVTNLDWDSISATDLLVLFSGFCQQQGHGGTIDKVQIYPSLFGLEQMKKDTMQGPPKDMFGKKQKTKRRNYGRNAEGKLDPEFMSDDEFQLDENDDGVNMAQLRKYEVNKMKYYYAVVVCDRRKTASKIIDEYNGFELELTNLRLTLSIVPDDLTFPQEIKEEASEIPMNYSFNAGKISRALNHSTVRLSWDQTDPKRLARLQANFSALQKTKGKKRKEINTSDEDEAYKDLIAGSSEESGYGDELEGSDDSQKKDQAHIDEMRKKLLGGLSNTNEGFGKNYRQNKDIKGSDSDESLDVHFGIGFGEDIGKKLLQQKQEKKERAGMSDFQKWQEKKQDKKREKKQQAKLKQMDKKEQGRMTEAEILERNKNKAQLELLISDSKTSKNVSTLEEVDDKRFKTNDSAFAVDPTHREFKKVVKGHNKVVKRPSFKHRK